MKIQDASKPKTASTGANPGHSQGARAGAVDGVSQMTATFDDVVEEMETKRLMDQVRLLGGQLSRYPTATLLAQYRSLVRMLLDKVRNGMHTKREYKWRRTERAMFVVVERVEEALAELEEVLRGEGERTRLLALVEEVKGCLLSLLF